MSFPTSPSTCSPRVVFGGNPLAVVTDARGLTTAQMQQIAAEFNYAESTFVLPPQDPENTAQVRVFTRVAEIPFAGHPNVGTGYVLARQRDIFGKPPGSNLRFEEKAGLVEVDIAFNEGTVAGARIKAPQSLETGATMEPDVFAKCASLSVEAIDTTHHIPTVASVGLPFFVAETDSASLATAHANLDAFHSAAARYALAELSGRVSVYVYARLDEGINSLRARMFSPMSGNWGGPRDRQCRRGPRGVSRLARRTHRHDSGDRNRSRRRDGAAQRDYRLREKEKWNRR